MFVFFHHQGNLLLQDHSIRIHLSNGFVLDTRVLGVLSLDLSGSISISLWNRNCEALIRNRCGDALCGVVGLPGGNCEHDGLSS